HRDEALTLSVRPLVDKLGGALSNWFVSLIAVTAGMTTGATASTITAHGQMVFKLAMFAFPATMLLIAVLIFAKKVLLTEEKHAEIVDQLEAQFSQSHAQKPAQAESFTLASPVSGQLMNLNMVADPVFAGKKLGDGFALVPADGKVYAPFAGTVRQLAKTRHSIVLENEHGVLVLIHIGLGTVKLNGTGFVSYVEEGSQVEAGQEILEFWDPVIKQAKLDDTVVVTVINGETFANSQLLLPIGHSVKALDDVFKLEGKK
ncbi:MAG: glucose PTS transporter subunit IIA, partial [Lactobacillus delbrueckii]|nr:glucose PTS transporter subunit IIA [Lactobacillus delbrueckii]